MAAISSRGADLELRIAQARIAELEATIADRGADRPSVIARARRRGVARFGFGVALVLIAGATASSIAEPRGVILEAAPPLPAVPVPEGALSWRAGPMFRESGVNLVDVDGDGAKDIVALAWRHGQDDLPLYVVVFDRKTYTIRWRAGPYPAAWRDEAVQLEVSGGRIVASDGAGVSHALDWRTGASLATFPTEKADLGSEDLRTPCLDEEAQPCKMLTSPALENMLGGIFHTKTVYPTDFIAERDRVTVALVVAHDGRIERHALRWDADANKVLWNVPLVPLRDPRDTKSAQPSKAPNEWTTLAHGRLCHLYQDIGGDYRLAGRDSKTGALLYDLAIPRLGDGSVIGAFSADRDELFLVANESLIVIDAASGVVAHRLRRF